ncbi:DUF7009 family protein [Hymenobacter psychrophilus]|uniref:Uncharacterized protein n=1 Tax=Hymenobacter psychrophilus TaxID=651662 RepID=A0A1H3HRU0_9BACT|nr:hypothetical protein [Hymenobacter psychrophilus]SDY18183.1 hypothetical protein SAMN04488069_106124 [Hymenobacter psychrophilus]
MKLRLDETSIRLRLDPEEVTEFTATGRLETAVPLGPGDGGQLRYSLERDADVPTLTVRQEPGRIRVLVPAAQAMAWAESDEISLRTKLEVAENQFLLILVEKDLGCAH